MGLKFLCTVSVALSLLALASPSLGLADIGSTLSKSLETKHNVNIFITMKDQFDVDSLSSRSYASRAEQITTIRDSLVQFTAESQKSLIEQIQASAKARSHPEFTTRSFWISNQLYVQDADADLVKSLMFRGDVEQIEEEIIFQLDNPLEVDGASHLASVPTDNDKKDGNILANQWGIEKIRAHTAWSMTNGTEGQGVVVGIIDTGARPSHTILRDNYMNDAWSWYDPVGQSSTARDDQGHGTHVTGTIVGINGYGVAPRAKWISCKAFDSRGMGAQNNILACFEFMFCPHNPTGGSANCEKAPRIVNNSWSRDGGSTAFNSAIAQWHRSGIIPVFANGNDGDKGCSTVGSPADQDVIAVGATTNSDALASFSSRGPTTRGGVKPDISAPGAPIRSAGNANDNAYVDLQGTSMASPHVAGVLALLVSRKSNITYTDAKNILQESAQIRLTFSSSSCGNIRDNVFPNNHFGHGRIDAVAALQLSENYKGSNGNGAQAVVGGSILPLLVMAALAKIFV